MEHYFAHSIAVTGGFASGKSTVAKSLAEMTGYCFFDADKEVADLLEKKAQGWLALSTIIDSTFFKKNGEIDKPKLRKAIFKDDLLREKVETVLHPLVRKALKRKIDEKYSKDGQKSLIEVPLLYEVNWQDDFDMVIVVSVNEQESIGRAIKRDGITVEQAKKIISAQVSLKEKVLLADYVIDNNKGCEETMKQLVELKKFLTPATLQPNIK